MSANTALSKQQMCKSYNTDNLTKSQQIQQKAKYYLIYIFDRLDGTAGYGYCGCSGKIILVALRNVCVKHYGDFL